MKKTIIRIKPFLNIIVLIGLMLIVIGVFTLDTETMWMWGNMLTYGAGVKYIGIFQLLVGIYFVVIGIKNGFKKKNIK